MMESYDPSGPIVMAIFSLPILFALWENGRAKRARQETIRHLADKGEKLTPELIDMIGGSTSTKSADLRRGILLIVFSIAIIMFGVLVNPTDSLRPWVGVSLFPGLIGLTYIVFGVTKLR